MVTTLTRDDDAVLSHVGRYRLTDAEIVSQCGLLADSELSAADGLLNRLVVGGWLLRSELCPESPGHWCYQLTPQAALELGHDAALAKPLKREQRVECYAVAKFCCCGDLFRQLFTKAEFQEKFQQLWYPGQPVRYYLEPDGVGSARLAYLKVDKDGRGRWDRLIDSCSRFLRQRTDHRRSATAHRRQVQAFARLVDRNQFQITVLTALEEKKRAIELELDRRMAARLNVPPLKVYTVPGLFAVMFPDVSIQENDAINH